MVELAEDKYNVGCVNRTQIDDNKKSRFPVKSRRLRMQLIHMTTSSLVQLGVSFLTLVESVPIIMEGNISKVSDSAEFIKITNLPFHLEKVI